MSSEAQDTYDLDIAVVSAPTGMVMDRPRLRGRINGY